MLGLIGENNAGKTNILKAIELFFRPTPVMITRKDLYYETDVAIEITIEFYNLTDRELERFESDPM